MALDPVQELKRHIRSGLGGAMRETRTVEISALRMLIGAIDNAQAANVRDRRDKYQVARFGGSSVEVQRKALSKAELAQLITDEIESRRAAARTMLTHGRTDRAEALIREADLLGNYLE